MMMKVLCKEKHTVHTKTQELILHSNNKLYLELSIEITLKSFHIKVKVKNKLNSLRITHHLKTLVICI